MKVTSHSLRNLLHLNISSRELTEPGLEIVSVSNRLTPLRSDHVPLSRVFQTIFGRSSTDTPFDVQVKVNELLSMLLSHEQLKEATIRKFTSLSVEDSVASLVTAHTANAVALIHCKSAKQVAKILIKLSKVSIYEHEKAQHLLDSFNYPFKMDVVGNMMIKDRQTSYSLLGASDDLDVMYRML